MSTEQAPMLFQDVTAGYGNHLVLRELNLQVPRGSICALLGRNGAGKTTLLRTALGFLRTRAGRVTVLGQDAWRDRFDLKDRIGYVPERQDLWPRMRGGELVDLAARLFSHWDSALASQLVDHYHLPLKQRIGTYSRGMQIQLAQVVALAHRPEVLILDEPVSGTDPVVRAEFAEHVVGYVHDTGASVLYSTHLVDEVRTLADRVAFLSGGKIILEGAVDEVLAGYTYLLVMLDGAAEPGIATLGPVAAQRRENVATLMVAAPLQEATGRARAAGMTVLEARRPGLQELFVAMLGEGSQRLEASHEGRQQQGAA